MPRDLNTIPITSVSGIGSASEKLFAKIGVYTVGQLLRYYPRGYENRGNVKTVESIVDGERASLILEVITPVVSVRAKGKISGKALTIQSFVAADSTGAVKITYFNRDFLKTTVKTGKKFRFFGIVDKAGKSYSMSSPEYEPVSENVKLVPIMPVYSLVAGLTRNMVAKAVKNALTAYKDDITETLSPEIIKKYKFPSLYRALAEMHFPRTEQTLAEVRKRLAFEELFEFFYKTKLLGDKDKTGRAAVIKYPDMRAFTSKLPFTLTLAQKKAIQDILIDITTVDSPDKNVNLPDFTSPSRRLIQGDVGSGKTVIACAAIYAVSQSGYQSALMAPTAILARQHYEEISKILSHFGVRCVLLTGGMRITEKRKVIESLIMGNADVVIGTHALLEENIVFKNLALVITDEQHRFGVMQRKALEDKTVYDDFKPHVIVMSATPIPRTLAMIMYCDLDISIVKQMPKGRLPVETFAVGEDKRIRVYNFISDFVKAGRQAYIVCPLAESDEAELYDDNGNYELKSAKEYSESLKNTPLCDARVEYIHGKMKQNQKDEIMSRFASGEIDVLVSTTVIEVGVNVPNASFILIENSERFGLSQLHQLRGRVGRGLDKSYCVLMSPLLNKAGNDSDFAKRVGIMCRSNSGFDIAEKDLELRGPGEFFGRRQSGEFKFAVASLSADMELVELAKSEADKRILMG